MPSPNSPAIRCDEAGFWSIPGFEGDWHQSLELPNGYQNFSWYVPGENANGVHVNCPVAMKQMLGEDGPATSYLYTQHQIFYEDAVLKHTRSSPNWEGGLVTFSTCKHLMRTYGGPRTNWVGRWLVGLCPAAVTTNCVMFAGRVANQFDSNLNLGYYLRDRHRDAWTAKLAQTNPRGDIYLPNPNRPRLDTSRYDHTGFHAPQNHTRSLEFYKRSPGSVSDRPDGKIPKWWRDIEYLYNGTRPPVFILNPCFLFTRPMVWVSQKPGRAALKLTSKQIAAGLKISTSK